MPRIQGLLFLSLAGLLLALCACDEHGAAGAEVAPALDAPTGHAHPSFATPGGLDFVDPQHPEHPDEVDFGELDVSESRSAFVHLKNVERVPITITNVQAGCSCTRPSLSYVGADGVRVEGDTRSTTRVLEIPPGVTAELELRVDGALSPVRNKDKLVVVNIVTDFDGDPYVTVAARMRINSPFQCIPAEIDIGRVGINIGGEHFTEIAGIGDSGARLVELVDVPADVRATLTLGEIVGKDVWRLSVRVEAPLKLGYQERTLKLTTTGPEAAGQGKPLYVKVRWTGADDFEVVPNRLMFLRGAQGEGERAEVELISHAAGQLFKVLRSELQGAEAAHFDTTIEAASPDALGRANRVRVTLRPKAELGQRAANGVLVLELDDPQFPRVEVPYLRTGK